MSLRRIRVLPVVAGVLLVSGIALILASLQIASTNDDEVVGATQPVPALATPIVSTGQPGKSEPAATRLVARAQAAQRALSYHGVKVVSRWNEGAKTSVVVTVDHQPGRGTVVVAGDGADDASGSGPANTAATASALPVSDVSADDAPLDPLDVLVRNYRLVSRQPAVVAGRRADTVVAERTDGTVAACFWVDVATGLVLRRELYDPAGATLESVTFTRVRITARSNATSSAATGTPTPSASVPAPSSSTTPAVRWVTMRTGQAEDLRAAGWPIPGSLDGGLTLYSLHEQAGASAPVVQLGYTDGLVSISVFLQRGVLDRTALAGYAPLTVGHGQVWCRLSGSAPFYVWQSKTGAAAVEATTEATTEAGSSPSRDIVVSATTESPSAPMAAVAAAWVAEPTRPAGTGQDAGVGDRVRRGVHRVTSWFDPQH